MSDLNDKQALLEEIENGIRAGNLEEGYRRYQTINNMDDVIECIRYADVVQPERKTGHWIDEGQHAQMDMGYHRFRCSECGGYIIEARTDAFCKWCGSYNGGRNDG